MMHHVAHLIERLGKRVFKILLRWVFFFLVLNTVIFFYFERHMFSSADEIPGKADAVVILWASVKGNQLSQVVQDRVEAAIQLYLDKKTPKILISGDGDPTQFYNEVKAINRYVINRGIPPADVFVDFAWFDTYDSLRRAQQIYGVKTLIISTQRFHLPRALLIARSLGIDAQWIIADRTIYSSAERNSLRESFARIKAIVELLIDAEPAVNTWTFIDIHGQGNTSTNL